MLLTHWVLTIISWCVFVKHLKCTILAHVMVNSISRFVFVKHLKFIFNFNKSTIFVILHSCLQTLYFTTFSCFLEQEFVAFLILSNPFNTPCIFVALIVTCEKLSCLFLPIDTSGFPWNLYSSLSTCLLALIVIRVWGRWPT